MHSTYRQNGPRPLVAFWAIWSSLIRTRLLTAGFFTLAMLVLGAAGCLPGAAIDPAAYLPDQPNVSPGDAGQATRTVESTPFCKSDTDCSGGQRCSRGLCFSHCSLPADCFSGQFCEGGVCQVRECVDDSSCGGGEKCAGGRCIAFSCNPDCTGKTCGGDGCEGFCGHCFDNTFCSAASFRCEEKINCTDECAENSTVCESIFMVRKCVRGANGCAALAAPEPCPEGQECQRNRCIPKDAPDPCLERECGPDGAGGNCGRCPERMACNRDGKCVNACADECRPNEKTCVDGIRIRVCARDANGCWVLKPEVCPAGQTCRNNACASCEPENDWTFCSRMGAQCGPVTGADNCGDSRSVSCGSCTPPLTCGGGGQSNLCGCAPKSKPDACAGKTCGAADDGCGVMLACGECPQGEVCAGIGLCCKPESDADFCSRQGKTCGNFKGADNCGNGRLADCGACQGRDTCGGGGQPNLCGCTPKPKPDACAGRVCGFADNGCSAIECGSCPSGQFCNASGQCQNTCTPESDSAFCSRLGKNCNSVTAADNCGTSRTVNCGSCSSPNTCGGGGTANVCGCTPNSKSSACSGRQCGTTGNGCGGTHDCGTCTGGQTCNGGGQCAGGGCTPESDSAFCSRMGKNCGVFVGTDNCGATRTANCGSCPSGTSYCSSNVCVNCPSNWCKDNGKSSGNHCGGSTLYTCGPDGNLCPSVLGQSSCQYGCSNGACVVPQCTSGPCCNTSTGKFHSSTQSCNSGAEGRCSGTCPQRIERRNYTIYCSGSSSSCNGSISYGSWSTMQTCSANQSCYSPGGTPTCYNCPTGQTCKGAGNCAP
ncbi:MAG: hypothetical protein GMKNLPBB_00863 [Myxococcota bacterium]|nr:hypothetical protein [Myxococcota bacterium]